MSFASEVLSPLGYIILILDYSVLEEITIPSIFSKVCVIVNDADCLCLDRSVSNRGETEKVLEWLDNSRSSFIKSFDPFASNSSVINLLNANTTERWDEAGLRKGRIDDHVHFHQTLTTNQDVTVSEGN